LPITETTFLLHFDSDTGGIGCTLKKRAANLQEHKAHVGENDGINLAVSLLCLLFAAHIFMGL